MRNIKKYAHWYFFGGLACAALFIWSAVFRIEAHRGRTFLHVFDVGQGDAIFIEAPSGNQVLVDGGPDAAVLERLGKVMPVWDRSIDLLVLTHPHADHLAGLLRVLERYRIGMVLESGVNHAIPEYELWRSALKKQRIPSVIAERGEIIHLGNGAILSVLAPFRPYAGASPQNIHDAAVVLLLRSANASALLMADAEMATERELLAAGDDFSADLLKVGHHGSKTSTIEGFLAAVGPRVAVISVGRKNRYGHPAQPVLDRLAASGVSAFRTDLDGTLTFVSDGEGFVRR